MRFTATVSFLLALSLFCVFVACKDVNGVGSDAASVPTTDAPVLTGSEPQKFEFQAEVNRMMKLLIHSLYKVKDIFLRELISNASDALDKLRFISLTKPEILGTVRDLNITVRADKEAKTLTITDTGIGMTKNDLIKNLGTIAKSGTAEFLAALEKDKSDVGLIGQFGVGFYSAFLVADMVTVTSKHNNDSQFIWSSHAETDFTINADPRGNTLGRGTQVVLHIKEGNEEFLEQESLEDIIRRYSEFINFPIYLLKDKTEEVEVPLSDDEVKDEALKRMAEKKQSTESSDGESPDADSEALVEDDNSPVKPIKTTKKEERKFQSWELMNPNKPIWTRDPKNVTEEEYNTFYKGLYRETSDPLGYMHFKAEGDMEFRSILYIPEKAPQGLLQNSERSLRNIKLFVRRVFITDELIEFIPKYLSFLKGIVDSDDLPLNVSRETLQQHKILRQIKKKVIRKALELVKALSEDVEKYGKFMEEYGVFLKLGVIEDVKNRKKLLKLLRFSTSYQSIDASNIAVSNKTSLDDYVKRMKKGQKQIFVLTGSSVEELENSVFSEKAVARGYEVLYFSEPIDEYIIQNVHDFQEKRFQNLAKDGFEFGDEDEVSKERVKSLNEEFTPLADWLKRVLASHVDKVVVSNRLVSSPCAIIAPQLGLSGNMERLIKSQALQSGADPMASYYASQKKILEINPNHPLVQRLLSKIVNKESDDDTEELALVLYETTLIRSGYLLDDNAEFTRRVERMLRINLNVDLNAEPLLESIVPAQEQAESDREPKEAESPLDEESFSFDSSASFTNGHDEL